MEAKPTVFIVDDEERVRIALARLMDSVGLQSRTYASAEEFIADYEPELPGCLVLDMRMTGMSGLDLQAHLQSEYRIRIPIIFITGHGDVAMCVGAMRRGAIDCLQKPFPDCALLEAIHKALEKDRRQRNEACQHRVALDRLARLTPREREVLEHVVAGKPNKVIAFDLGASEKTIKIHRGRVMAKMEAESLPELVMLAQWAGVSTAKVGIEPPPLQPEPA